MRHQINDLVNQILDTLPENLTANKSLVDSLTNMLCEATDIDLHPKFFMDEHASITAQGKAVSTTTAAQCAEEFMRTQVFLRGVYQAMQDQLQQKDSISIVYAGTGPFGLLLIPLLPLIASSKVKVTLLDIHDESLLAVNRVIDLLEVRYHIDEIHCVDILQWSPKVAQKFDLIISETMKAMLDQEPQVSIFSHLSPYLKSDGSLIPQQIIIEGWMQTAPANLKPKKLGEVFTLSYRTALELSQQDPPRIETFLTIPEYTEELADLKFTTDIQIYGDHWLTEKQCSLNLPLFITGANPEPNSPVNCQYHFGLHPGFKFDFQKRLRAKDLPLSDHSNRDILGVPYLYRIWHKAQKDKNKMLSSDINRQEYLLNLQVFDILKLDAELANQTVYQCETSYAWADYILEKNQGSISSIQKEKINHCFSEFLNTKKDKLKGNRAINSVLT